MRVLWIVLMVCLLPLRGWASQLMAVDMAMQQLAHVATSTPVTVGSHIAGPIDAMPQDCPMHAEASGTPTNLATSSPACSGCDTCELCLAIASFTVPQFQAMPFNPRVAPAAVPHGFFSADHASRLKPPIS